METLITIITITGSFVFGALFNQYLLKRNKIILTNDEFNADLNGAYALGYEDGHGDGYDFRKEEEKREQEKYNQALKSVDDEDSD